MELKSQSDELSLAELVAAVWRYRVVFFITTIAGAGVFLLGAFLYYLWAPTVESVNLPFRVLFDGAEHDQYPNGLAFSTTDIIAGPVLERVYQQNKLDEYLNYDQFKGAVFISETNNALTVLDKEYQQKLGNNKLSTVDRQILEAEYQEKRQALSNESYELHLLYDSTVTPLPANLAEKVLKDVLKEWVALTDGQKGVLKYRIPVLSRNILPESLLATQDYIVTIDIFKNKIDAVLTNIDTLSHLPGAQLVRVGDEKLGLEEVATNLRDTQQFKLDPLVGLVRSTGLSKNPGLASLYLENQLFQIHLDEQEAQEKIKVLESSLNSYLEKNSVADTSGGKKAAGNIGSVSTTYIPQLGDSFLDRVVEMSTQSNDAEFRQNVVNMIVDEGMIVARLNKKSIYYQSLIDAMKHSAKPSAQRTEVLEMIKARFVEIQADIVQSLDQVNSIYQVLSENNLNPQAGFYTVTAPMSMLSSHAVDYKKIVVAGLAWLILLVGGAGLGCVLHCNLRKKSSV